MSAVTPQRSDVRTAKKPPVTGETAQRSQRSFDTQNILQGAQSTSAAAPTSDPFTDALRESQDGDSDVERASSGRHGRDGVKSSDGEGGPEIHAQVEQSNDAGTSDGGEGDGGNKSASGGAQIAEAYTHAAQRSKYERYQPSLPVAEQHSNSLLATVSLDRDASASFLMEASYQMTSEILKLPDFQRQSNVEGVLNHLQSQALKPEL